VQKGPRGGIPLPDILRQDQELIQLDLSLAHITNLTDKDMASLARALSEDLVVLNLSFEGCSKITDDGIASLSRSLPPRVENLTLDFVGCKHITDFGIAALADRLCTRELKYVRLDFAACSMIGRPGIKALARNLTETKKVEFHGTFRGTEVNRDFDSLYKLQRYVGMDTSVMGVLGTNMGALGVKMKAGQEKITDKLQEKGEKMKEKVRGSVEGSASKVKEKVRGGVEGMQSMGTSVVRGGVEGMQSMGNTALGAFGRKKSDSFDSNNRSSGASRHSNQNSSTDSIA